MLNCYYNLKILEHDDKSNLKLEVVDRKFRGTNFIYTLKTNSDLLIPVFVIPITNINMKLYEKFGIKRPINIESHCLFLIKQANAYQKQLFTRGMLDISPHMLSVIPFGIICGAIGVELGFSSVFSLRNVFHHFWRSFTDSIFAVVIRRSI